MFLVIAVVAAAAVYCEAASVTTCTNSYICGQGMCCRAADGSVLTDQKMGGFGPHFMSPDGGHQNGTCSTRLAQKGEICDVSCGCDTGLTCYRPMSGICCPPMTCHDAVYVKQQQEYWARCLSNPGCALPQ